MRKGECKVLECKELRTRASPPESGLFVKNAEVHGWVECPNCGGGLKIETLHTGEKVFFCSCGWRARE